MPANCSLLISIESIAATSLKLRYEFQNNTPNTVFLFNKFWSTSLSSGEDDIRPNQVNTQIIDGHILVSKAMIPVPEDVEVEIEYTPYQTRVAANERYQETLELQLPLILHTCYTIPWHQLAGKQTENLPLFFELGYVEVASEAESSFKIVETPQGQVYFRSSTYRAQSVIRTGPIAANILVYSS